MTRATYGDTCSALAFRDVFRGRLLGLWVLARSKLLAYRCLIMLTCWWCLWRVRPIDTCCAKLRLDGLFTTFLFRDPSFSACSAFPWTRSIAIVHYAIFGQLAIQDGLGTCEIFGNAIFFGVHGRVYERAGMRFSVEAIDRRIFSSNFRTACKCLCGDRGGDVGMEGRCSVHGPIG